MTEEPAVVAVIDDDQSIREALGRMFETVSLRQSCSDRSRSTYERASRARLIALYWMCGCPALPVSTFRGSLPALITKPQLYLSPRMETSRCRSAP